MTRTLVYAASALCAALFLYTQHAIFYGTPIDRMLLFSQKIFYYHVPCAFAQFTAVFTCGIAAISFLRKRDPRHDDAVKVGSELAVLFGAMMLVTGSIWGRAAWGVWWQWDARLTTALLLEMVMIGCVLVRKYGGPGSERLSAGLAIFGLVLVPFIYASTRIFRTLHPPSSVVPGLTSEMRSTFWLSVILFQAFFYVLLVARLQQARSQRRLREARELGLDEGLLE